MQIQKEKPFLTSAGHVSEAFVVLHALGVLFRPVALILRQDYRDADWRRIAIRMGGVYIRAYFREGDEGSNFLF